MPICGAIPSSATTPGRCRNAARAAGCGQFAADRPSLLRLAPVRKCVPFDIPTDGRIVAGFHRLPIRVYFEDTDLTGIVYHTNYLRFMERGRTEMLRHAGVDHTVAMAAGDGFWAVHAMNLVWHRPARLDDQLVVVTHVAKVRAAATELMQVVMRGDERLCSAAVTAAFLSMDGRPQRQSKAWHDRFTLLMREAMAV